LYLSAPQARPSFKEILVTLRELSPAELPSDCASLSSVSLWSCLYFVICCAWRLYLYTLHNIHYFFGAIQLEDTEVHPSNNSYVWYDITVRCRACIVHWETSHYVHVMHMQKEAKMIIPSCSKSLQCHDDNWGCFKYNYVSKRSSLLSPMWSYKNKKKTWIKNVTRCRDSRSAKSIEICKVGYNSSVHNSTIHVSSMWKDKRYICIGCLDIIFLIKFCLHPQLNLTDKETILVRTNTVHKLVGLLLDYRQFYLNADSDTLRQFYLSCIRPHLEYACTVRDPYLCKGENASAWPEAVQKFAYNAARTGIWTMRACWVIWIFQHCNKGGYN